MSEVRMLLLVAGVAFLWWLWVLGRMEIVILLFFLIALVALPKAENPLACKKCGSRGFMYSGQLCSDCFGPPEGGRDVR